MLGRSRLLRSLVGIIASVLVVGASTAVLLPLRESVNSTTVALIDILAVVLIALVFERIAAFVASLLSTISFNYFFIPPYNTLAISDPDNWVTLVVFLAIAVTVGHLSATSNRRRADAERLYKELGDTFEISSEAEALRRSEKLKTALLDAVTHDFRTPLTSIKAAVTALIDNNQLPGAERTLDQHGRGELLQVIDEESDRLNTFVESMVELARFQSGEKYFKRSSVSPEELVLNAARRARAIRPTHDLLSQVQPGLPSISVDARSLVEAVYNLIDNAAKYSTAGSSIFIRAALSGENVRFEVEDEGPGVPTADREAVFERFSQGTVKKDGLGMGLAIVRGIIEAHGGRIWIESGKKGARFVFELPPDINGR